MMSEVNVRGMSRRGFLNAVGKAGGAVAVCETMVAMGLVGDSGAWAGVPSFSPGHDRSVLVLGAGIGGLTSALLLSRAGYRVRILEASSRAGGRNHTARRGDTVIEHSGEHGFTVQQCHFDKGLYLNLGPGRLPYHHRRVLGYCQELGVELEPYLMNTPGNLFQTDDAFGGKPQTQRSIQHDTRGYIAEMLAKVVKQGALDEQLDDADTERLLELLTRYGNLGANGTEDSEVEAGADRSLTYLGTGRAGCADVTGISTPNVGENCAIPRPSALESLLDADFWNHSFYDPLEYEWQPTMFQPVGGMDKIVEGFVRAVGHLIEYNAPVSKIRLRGNEVVVTWLRGSEEVTEVADYCISNIPCPILAKIDHNFGRVDASFAEAVEFTSFESGCKVGWQCNSRFWESDKYEIYGGISWTSAALDEGPAANISIEQIWYPSTEYFSQKGTLTGAYIHDKEGNDQATRFGKLSVSERLQFAKELGAKLHPEFQDNSIVPIEKGISVAWQNVPYLAGGWPSWIQDEAYSAHDVHYRRLLLPVPSPAPAAEGPTPLGAFFIVGDQASTLPGWQEGAMMSAEHVVGLLTGAIRPDAIPERVEAPDTRLVTQGNG
jgi:monoamine oxidase